MGQKIDSYAWDSVGTLRELVRMETLYQKLNLPTLGCFPSSTPISPGFAFYFSYFDAKTSGADSGPFFFSRALSWVYRMDIWRSWASGLEIVVKLDTTLVKFIILHIHFDKHPLCTVLYSDILF